MSDKAKVTLEISGDLKDFFGGGIQDEDGPGFMVTPLTSCPHIEICVSKEWAETFEKWEEFDNFGEFSKSHACSDCGHIGENWICLFCKVSLCSRYINKHSLCHSEVLDSNGQNHTLAISLADLSVWCYECDNYIDNPVFLSVKNKLHKIKFGQEIGKNR